MNTKRLKLAIICGGQSPENDISILSAQNILKKINRKRYDIIQLGIKTDGSWIYSDDIVASLNGKKEYKNVAFSFKSDKEGHFNIIDKKGNIKQKIIIDVAFPVLHGVNGEDGTIQGFFELAHIPYIGSRISSSAIGLDKSLTKIMLKCANIPTLKFLTIRRHQWETDSELFCKKINDKTGFPCIIKPAGIGSNIGITKVNTLEDLHYAIAEAFKYDRKIIVERWVEKREMFCGIIGNEHPFVSNIGELSPDTVFYENPRSKYFNDSTEFKVPADIPGLLSDKIMEYSLKAFRLLDCCGMARFDFLIEKENNKIFLSEVNTIPGFTDKSIFPRLMEASGISYVNMIDRLVDLAFERFNEKKAIHFV